MKKRLIFLAFLLVVVLVGCSDDEAIKDFPDKQEIDKEEKRISLPRVGVYNSDDTSSTYVERDVWCWEEEEPCSLEPNPPSEVVYGNGWPPLKVEPSEEFRISLTTNEIPVTDHIRNPDKVEAVQFKGDEEKKVEVIDKRRITAPMEEGKYYYSLKLEWDGELVGQAYFAFSILVQ